MYYYISNVSADHYLVMHLLIWLQDGYTIALLCIFASAAWFGYSRVAPVTVPFTMTNQERLNRRGKILLITGPMYAQKSSELKRRIDVKRISASKKQQRCLLIRWSKDTRYHPTSFATHSGVFDSNVCNADNLGDNHVQALANEADFIFIDEGQFFKDLLDYCLKWARAGIEVHIAALDAYANQVLWPEIARVIPWAVSLKKFNATCTICGDDAPLTRTLIPTDKAEIKIGTAEYLASCIFCCEKKTNLI